MVFQTPFRGRGVVCALALASVICTATAQAATRTVAAGGDLQAALDAAQPGDVITLAAGATFVGNFVLRNKGASTTSITIRSATPDSQLPPCRRPHHPGVRAAARRRSVRRTARRRCERRPARTTGR